MRAGFPRHATIAGDRPPRYGQRKTPLYRRARACPSPCRDLGGNGLGWHAVFAQIGRSRGTGPRATVREKPSLYRRAWALGCHTRMRAGFPRHAAIARETAWVGVRFSRRSGDRGGQAPALRLGPGYCIETGRSLLRENRGQQGMWRTPVS